LIELINKYYDNYVWLYEARTVNRFWVYNLNFSKTIENKYNIYHNNKCQNINCEIYKQYILSLYNVSDNILSTIFKYFEICDLCMKQNKYIKLGCLCQDKKKCTKTQCDGLCKQLQTFKLKFLDNDLIVDLNKKTQSNTNNYGFQRNIKRINKNDLINDLSCIQGISSLKRDKKT